MPLPAVLPAELPKAFRDAFALVQAHGDFLGERQTDILLKLLSVPSAKVARAVRGALNGDGSAKERITHVADELEAAGIQVPAKVEALPEVNKSEVWLVAWMAVRGTRKQTA